MQTKQRGSGWSIKLVFNLYKLFGYKFIYYLMYLVTFFYFIFASNVKESLKIYYKRLEIPFTSKIYYEHLRIFAITLVDRFISKYDSISYKFVYQNEKEIRQIVENKTILLFSHFGGWSSSANQPITKNKINIVMQEVLLDGIKDIEDSIEKKIGNTKIIDIAQGPISVSIEIAQAISNNEIIAMMADRATDKKYMHKTKFFNKDGYFNENPFKIAYRTQTPLLAYFTIYKGLQTYEIEARTLEIDYNLNEKEAINKVLEDYAKLFEDILKEYPNQWFNFYNFWEKE